MKIGWLSLALAVLLVPARSASAYMGGLGRFGPNYSAAPAPSDFSADVGDRPMGEGERAKWNPLGFLGELPIKYTLALSEGYDTNIFTTHLNPVSSGYTNLAGGAAYQFGNRKLQLSTSLGLGLTYYYSRPGDNNDFNGQFSLSAVYKFNRRLTLSINTTTALLSQPDTTLIGGSNVSNGDYITSSTSLDAAFQWTGKISSVTGYQAYTTKYLQANVNPSLSFFSQTFKQSFHWLFLPKTTLVAEYRANPITYPRSADLNSFGNFALLGFDQTFNPRTRWTMRFGAEQRFNNNPTDGTSFYLGPFLESNFSYQFGPTSQIGWNLRYGTEPSGVADVSQRQTFRTGLSVAHGFTSRISGSLGANFEVDNYNQSNVITPYTQTIVDISLGLAFKINQSLSLSASYQYIQIYAPKNVNSEYTRNIAFAGINFNF